MNRTLYVPDKDKDVWVKAKRLIPFYLGKSVSDFLNDTIKDAVEKLEAQEESASKSKV